jgi:hypothetical protein
MRQFVIEFAITSIEENKEAFNLFYEYFTYKGTRTKQELKDFKNKLVDSINLKAILASGFNGTRFIRELAFRLET